MTDTTEQYQETLLKDKKKDDQLEAEMPSDREFLLDIMAEEMAEQEEFDEWCRDQILDEMAREAVEEEDFQNWLHEERCK